MTQKLIGPFKQILTMEDLPLKGRLSDHEMNIIPKGGVLISDEKIEQVGDFEQLAKKSAEEGWTVDEMEEDLVLLPGLIDAHTHICWGGSRARDYAARNAGKTYLEIAQSGGGIWDTVTQTRKASSEQLKKGTMRRLDILMSHGVTTVEAKSGYGLNVDQELKLLKVIKECGAKHVLDVVPTCLAAHIIPREFESEDKYLKYILEELVPVIEAEELARRFDIFIEEGAFTVDESRKYLKVLSSKGFDLAVHADQFSTGGSLVGIECGAISVDHLEASGEREIRALAASNTIPVVLPGATLGLGCGFSPARRLLDAGSSLAIASDWNPGSAPGGYLLAQAAILGAFEKLSSCEVFAGITYRAAAALGLSDRGVIETGCLADFVGFQTSDFREILYNQGQLRADSIWKKGIRYN